MIQRGEERPTEFVAVSTLPHVILPEGLHEVAEFTFQNAKDKLLPGEKVPARADEGLGENALPRPSPTICGGPPSPRGRGLFFWMMDSATSPSAPRRMTGRHAVNSESSLTRETN